MSTLKVNNIIPFSGQTVNIQGDFTPSGSNQSLGSEANPWSELYVSTGSVNFVAPGTAQNPQQASVAMLKAGGEAVAGTGQVYGMIYTETNYTYRGSFSVGTNNRALGTASFTTGLHNTASGNYSQAHGFNNRSIGNYSYTKGDNTRASGSHTHAEGFETLSTGLHSRVRGYWSTASGDHSNAEGFYANASGIYSHAEGRSTIASEDSSHAEGANTRAIGFYSHAEGSDNVALGYGTHAEGYFNTASGDYSHAEGQGTKALGGSSHAEGLATVALGLGSHAEGLNTIASGSYQSVVGQWNALNNTSSVFIVGTGTFSTRKDGFSVELDSQNVRPHIVIPTNAANPTNPKTGSMYFNPSTNLMFVYNGTAWRSASFA
jgi:hypothetical protein